MQKRQPCLKIIEDLLTFAILICIRELGRKFESKGIPCLYTNCIRFAWSILLSSSLTIQSHRISLRIQVDERLALFAILRKAYLEPFGKYSSLTG